MADISKLKTPGGTTYNLKDETARSSKTNISVLPNDGGEIKTKFRMSQKGYTNGAIWYYPLCKLPKDNAENYASAILSGRAGGWTSNNMSSITSLIWNRGSSDIALLDIAGSANAMSRIWNVCDIVVYTNSDTTDTVYLKCNDYFTFDVDIELFQSGCEILYNGSYVTTTPSGTLAASASTSTKRAELINGKLYIAGSELAFKSAIPTKTSQLTNDSGFKTTDNNTTYSLSKSGSTITLTGSDGSTTSVTDSNTTYSTATQSANGLMSAADKTKLDGLSKITVERFDATTDEWSHVKLFATGGKVPIAAVFVYNAAMYSIFAFNTDYYIELYGTSMNAIPNTAVSFDLICKEG